MSYFQKFYAHSTKIKINSVYACLYAGTDEYCGNYCKIHIIIFLVRLFPEKRKSSTHTNVSYTVYATEMFVATDGATHVEVDYKMLPTSHVYVSK